MAQKVEDASLWPLPEYFDRLKIFTYFDPRMFAKLHYAKLFNLVLKNVLFFKACQKFGNQP